MKRFQYPPIVIFFLMLNIFSATDSFAQAPVNNECSGATLLTSSTTCIDVNGTLDNSTYNPSTMPATGCGATNKRDVWYRFVAQAPTQDIDISNAPSQMRIQVFSGTCGSFTSIACGNSSLTVTGLSIGTTYYIRIYRQSDGQGDFEICITHAPLVNDNCSGAISLTSNVSCVNTASTLNTSTASAIPVGCFAAGTYYDVWYSFIAANTTETITISSLGVNITNPQMQLYSGTCAALTSLQCVTGTSITRAGLTIGNTYYVRVANFNSNPSGAGTVANFNICVTHTPPANDECTGAISLTSNASCINTSGTLVGATYSTIASIGCGTASRNDVWYSFVALSTSTTITLSSAPANPRIQLFSGSCGSLTSIACGNSSLTATGLTPGTTYFVRIYTNPDVLNGTFNLCITHLPPTNDNCSGAISLTSGSSCVNTSATLNQATASAVPVGCFAPGVYYDVWFSFVAVSTTETVTISSLGLNITNPRMQLYSGTCAALTSIQCVIGTSITGVLLTVGNTYYVRVANFTSDPSGFGTLSSFNICVTHVGLANDLCDGAISITSSATCNNVSGTTVGATYSAATGLPGCSGLANQDVWYSFVAQTQTPTISGAGTGANSTRFRLQLFSGNCGALTSIACGSNSIAATGLTIGNTYYVRVYTSSIGNLFTFNLCITDPPIAAKVEQSKSYVNITKLATGGTVEPGDILEIRATFVVKAGSVDSVAYLDTLESNGGLIFLDSIATRTNEGKVYNSFTNAQDGDAGWYSVSGADTIIRINIGSGSNGSARGAITFLDRPRVYSSATIIMATYRVQVYVGYDGKIDWGGGGFTYRDKVTGVMKSVPFKDDSLVVYVSPGLCSSTLSSSNQVGLETNGTFGAPISSSPLARNRGTSTAIPSYIYDIFRAGANGPQDYYYGVTNNTSATFAIVNTLNKATLGSSVPQRVFSHWDIIGDHTGASNTAKGNPPCDTTKPVSAANPCGYMLVVNAAYKTDTAFRSTVTNLCPNTYYELSAWVRNICYKCGCDSTGKGAANANVATAPAYVPFAANDSSGVPPNLAFQLNGQDYYQTGNIYYTGTGPGITQAASDSVNSWVKRGFVYKTGPSETSFELLIRNNAPGGGGNDWAIDDVVVATCSPEVTVTPGPNPFVCDTNSVDVGAIISSYYDNYTYYKWEKSTDDGATWSSTDVSGSITPTWNGSAWAYDVSYPTFVALPEDSGSKFRVLIASTASNLSASSCSFSGGATVTLDVNPCDFLLNVGILSFKGRNENNQGVLYWTTSKEEEPVKYEIQKSKDGSRFVKIGEMAGYKDPPAETNRYTYVDPELLDNTLSWYRIKAINTQDNKFRYSKLVQLIGDKAGLQIESLVNPFNSHVKFDLVSGDDGLVQVEILDQYQHKVRSVSYNLVKGRNRINIDKTDNLPAGFYILRVISDNNVINRKIIKRG